jgi:hypothetical protein
MDATLATAPAAIDDLLAVQGILAGVSAMLDEVERSMPPIVCTWHGTAREAYGRNLSYLSSQFALLVPSIANARAAIASAISVAS